jgi:hypothetical protein
MATPASDRFRVIYHPLICPDCGSGDITCDEVESGGQPLRHANFRRRVWLPLWPPLAWTSTFTTYAIPATPWSPRPGRTSAN